MTGIYGGGLVGTHVLRLHPFAHDNAKTEHIQHSMHCVHAANSIIRRDMISLINLPGQAIADATDVPAGPLGHWWYQSLERMVSSRFTKGTLAFILTKVTPAIVNVPVTHALNDCNHHLEPPSSQPSLASRIANDPLYRLMLNVSIWPYSLTHSLRKGRRCLGMT